MGHIAIVKKHPYAIRVIHVADLAKAHGRREESGKVAAGREKLHQPQTSRSGELFQQRGAARSEEHTSELQSLRHLVGRLLLEKTTSSSAAPGGPAPPRPSFATSSAAFPS